MCCFPSHLLPLFSSCHLVHGSSSPWSNQHTMPLSSFQATFEPLLTQAARSSTCMQVRILVGSLFRIPFPLPSLFPARSQLLPNDYDQNNQHLQPLAFCKPNQIGKSLTLCLATNSEVEVTALTALSHLALTHFYCAVCCCLRVRKQRTRTLTPLSKYDASPPAPPADTVTPLIIRLPLGLQRPSSMSPVAIKPQRDTE